jgi:hypothetical protein
VFEKGFPSLRTLKTGSKEWRVEFSLLAATALATPAIPGKAFYCPIGLIGACCQQYRIHTDEGISCTSPFLHFAALSDENQANMHCNYIVSRPQRPRNGSVKATT